MNAKFIKKISMVLVVLIFLISGHGSQVFGAVDIFSDVPVGHWAFDAVHKLRELEITNGIGSNRFGIGMEVKKCEFVSYIVRLMKFELISPDRGSFEDNMDKSKWYYPYVETALKHGVISATEEFFPQTPITRQEMAVMIINALGFGAAADLLENIESGFDDVFENTGYISMAKDFGIITGTGAGRFKPDDRAKREEAAAMMIRMYERLNEPLNELHAFYAINSYSQMDMIPLFDCVSFGWSRLELDLQDNKLILNTSDKGNNEYNVPEGYIEPLEYTEKSGVMSRLMIFADNTAENPILDKLLSDSRLRKLAVEEITGFMKDNEYDFDGVVIDFEGLKGENNKKGFVLFLNELKEEPDMSIYVTVHPARGFDHEYFDGYDFGEIGKIADKVILMAHDYYAKKLTDLDMKNGYTTTPLTPLDEVYFALKAITDEDNGVKDRSKILLQLSFDSAQWKLEDGEVVNRYPYNPGYDAIRNRLLSGAKIKYYQAGHNPYAVFEDNVLWYEDTRSVKAKIILAAMFKINGISLWRLGNIPDYEDEDIFLDVWKFILEKAQREVIK